MRREREGGGVTFVAARHSPSLSDMNSREAKKKKNKKKAVVVNAESTGAYIFVFFLSFRSFLISSTLQSSLRVDFEEWDSLSQRQRERCTSASSCYRGFSLYFYSF